MSSFIGNEQSDWQPCANSQPQPKKISALMRRHQTSGGHHVQHFGKAPKRKPLKRKRPPINSPSLPMIKMRGGLQRGPVQNENIEKIVTKNGNRVEYKNRALIRNAK
jgi:hypothetical protein